MDRMHDKATKFFNEVRKKQVSIAKAQHSDCNKEQTKTHLSSHNCCYCHKVFFNSSYLLKHILRRHAEDFMSLHRKCLRQESNNNTCDAKYILEVIRNEFSAIRKELTGRQNREKAQNDDPNLSRQNETSTVPEKSKLRNSVCSDNCKNQECHEKGGTGLNSKSLPLNQTHSIADVDSNEIIRIRKENSLDVERNIKHLYCAFDRLNEVVKNEVFSKNEVHNLITASENKILKAQEERFLKLQSRLQEDLISMLSNQLKKNSVEWNAQVSELTKQIENLSFIVDFIRKQVNSADNARPIKNRPEDEAVNCLDKSRQPENCFRAFKVSKTHSNLNCNSITSVESAQNDKTLSSKYTNSVKECTFTDIQGNNILCNTQDVSSILATKMLSLGISPCSSKIQSKDYVEKMKQIENLKEQLARQTPEFFEIFNKFNKWADQRASPNSKKKLQKLRFSEPLTLNRNVRMCNKERLQSRKYPVTNHKIPGSSEQASLSKNVSSRRNRKKFQNKTQYISENNKDFRFSENPISSKNIHQQSTSQQELDSIKLKNQESPVSEYKTPKFSETSISGKHVSQQSSQQKFDNVKVSVEESFEYDQGILEIGGGGDCLKSFPEMKKRSKKLSHSTPLKEKKIHTSVNGDNSRAKKSVDESSIFFSHPVTSLTSSVKDTIFVPDVEDQIETIDASVPARITYNCCTLNSNSKSDCFLSAKPLIPKENDISLVSVLRDSSDKNKDCNKVQATETFDLAYSKNRFNNEIHLSDENVSSLESLSEWEDDNENNS